MRPFCYNLASSDYCTILYVTLMLCFESKYILMHRGPGSSAGIATYYGLDGPGIESRWGEFFPEFYSKIN